MPGAEFADIGDIADIARLWFTTMWGRPDYGLVDRFVAPEYHPTWVEMPEKGPALVKKEIAYFRNIFPDLAYSIKASAQDGQRVWVWYEGKGTHSGEGWGIKPTGRQTTFEGAALLFFDANSQVYDLWEAFSMYDIFAGSGAVPSFWEIGR